MNDAVPSFLRTAKPRGMELVPESAERGKSAAPETFMPDANKNASLNFDIVTPEQVKRLSAEAIEKVKWRLPSTPYGVQAYAVLQAGDALGFNYFMEQGLGKTKTTLADFWNRYEAGLNDCMIVITVNSMKLTWAKEMEEENYPFDIHIWPKVKEFSGNAKGQVIIMNYDAIRAANKGSAWLNSWIMGNRPLVVFDESTSIANHGSKQGKAAVGLWAKSRGVRNLAGLPNPNSPADFYNQLKVTYTDVGHVFYSFRNRFCIVGGFKDKKVIGAKNERDLARVMQGRVFFADKATWAPSLPKRIYARRHVEMTPAQKVAYKTMAKELYAEIQDGVVEIEQALSKSTKLQQISGGWIYDQDRVVHRIGKGEDPKQEAVKEYLQHADGKTIVFAHYRPSVHRLIEAFPHAAYALSKQEMTEDELERQKARFNDDPECTIFIAPIAVMQFGHTLVGTPTNPCTATVYYENTYSRLARSQSQDRSHRWGATGAEITYVDVIASPVDEAIISSLKTKADMAEALTNALKEVIYGS